MNNLTDIVFILKKSSIRQIMNGMAESRNSTTYANPDGFMAGLAYAAENCE